MTAQASDNFLLDGQTYAITGINAGGLSHPEQFGIKLDGSSPSFCWHGYISTYGIIDSTLNLIDLVIYSKATEQPIINGVSIRRDKHYSCYENLNMPCNYTGGILISKGFIKELYVHMGFHPAWKYEEVWELIFEKGCLVKRLDKSATLAAVREKLLKESLHPNFKASQRDVLEWVKKCFEHPYY